MFLFTNVLDGQNEWKKGVERRIFYISLCNVKGQILIEGTEN